MKNPSTWILRLLHFLPLYIFALVICIFTPLSDRFLQINNFVNIIIQTTPVAVLGIGLTFVLLTGGIDLSVGAVMYLCACVLGITFKGVPLIVSVPAILGLGLVAGAVNGLFITAFRVAPFIVTLSTLFIGRGLAMYMSGTKMVFFPRDVTGLNRVSLGPIPFAICALALVFLLSWTVLRETPFGRRLYATGADPGAARKAGINVDATLFIVYGVSGVCAAAAAFVSITQIGAVSPSFGNEREFSAIAAAVLGGTSLFGGRGGVGGTVFGALLIQTVNNGLVIINANPYIYPLVTAAIIFTAVFADSLRARVLRRLQARQIRLEPAVVAARS